jgi:protoheme IX farnesyltransferase
MSHRSGLKDFSSAPAPERHFAGSTLLSDYWALTKPEVNFLILITTFVGFYLASGTDGRFSFARLFNTLLGTLLVASGTGTLNQYLERKFDAQMRRTARRPAAAGRLTASAVVVFGTALAAAGSIYLAIAVNILASLLATLTLLVYLFVYTPLKRKTPLCVLVGAFPGAMPPLIGWAAASGHLPLQAWTLYALLFLWQFPHFMAIAWMYREDYDRAGYLVLPHQDRARASFVRCQTLLPLLALTPLSLLLRLERAPQTWYWIAALFLNLGFLHYGMQFVLNKSGSAARRLLMASIIYLPLLFMLIVVDSGAHNPRAGASFRIGQFGSNLGPISWPKSSFEFLSNSHPRNSNYFRIDFGTPEKVWEGAAC